MTSKNTIVKDCIQYTYKDTYTQWNIKISDISSFTNYIRCHIHCNENCFYTYTGLSDNELWICFPHIDKATILSTMDDVEWNTNELYRLLKNKKDAISIASTLMELEPIIYNFK